MVFIVVIVSVSLDISYRTNVLRLLFPIGLLMTFYLMSGVFLNRRIINYVVSILFITPLFFLGLGVTDKFNIFQEKIIDIEIVVDSNNGSNDRFNKVKSFCFFA